MEFKLVKSGFDSKGNKFTVACIGKVIDRVMSKATLSKPSVEMLVIKTSLGISTCSKHDKFEQELGEERALGKALRNVEFAHRTFRRRAGIKEYDNLTILEESVNSDLNNFFGMAQRNAQLMSEFMNKLPRVAKQSANA